MEGGSLLDSFALLTGRDIRDQENKITLDALFDRDKDNIKTMNHLQKYKEIQRRRKLLYGVKDVKKLISKSVESTQVFNKDICSIDEEEELTDEMDIEQGKIEFLTNKRWSIKDFLKPENFIIPMSS